jgi:hypothetical protein
MNIKLLKRIIRKIRQEPKQFDMDTFFFKRRRGVPNCGTTACIAGWAIALNKRLKPINAARTLDPSFASDGEGVLTLECPRNPEKHGAKALKLELEDAKRLFYTENWPCEFRQDHQNAETPRAKVNVTIERIKHFIKTRGEE